MHIYMRTCTSCNETAGNYLAERARMRERSHNQVIKMEIYDGYMVRAILP